MHREAFQRLSKSGQTGARGHFGEGFNGTFSVRGGVAGTLRVFVYVRRGGGCVSGRDVCWELQEG